jgi:exosortase
VFLLQRRYGIVRAIHAPKPTPWGLLVVAPALLLFGWAHYTGAMDLLLLSLPLVILGGALCLSGPALTRQLLVPALFLCFAVPMPGVMTNQIVYAFQIGTASLSSQILALFGVPVLHLGDMIYTRTGIFHVIETCSGLRLTETLAMSAIAYAQVIGTRRTHAIFIVAISPVLGFLLNTVRVLMIILNPLSGVTADHTI